MGKTCPIAADHYPIRSSQLDTNVHIQTSQHENLFPLKKAAQRVMPKKLLDRAVIITSGTKRLGLALAKEALRLGFDAILHYRSHRDEADRWLERHPNCLPRVAFLQCDLTPESAPQTIVKAAEMAGRLEGLVNNASVFTEGNLGDFSHFRSVLENNALIPAALAEAYRKKVGNGWIIHVTDANIVAVNRNYQNYRISKLLLTELTRQQSALFAPHVRVNAIAPGAILPSNGATDESLERARASTPLGRTGTLTDIRRAFAFIVGNDYLSGHVLPVDGGRSSAEDGSALTIR